MDSLESGRIREGDVVRAKSNWVREGNDGRFQGRRKGKEKSFWFVVIKFKLIFGHPCFYVVCACIEFFGGLVTSLRGVYFWSCVSSAKSWWFTEWLAMISERGVMYMMKRMGPSTEPWGTQYLSCDGDEDELLTWQEGVGWQWHWAPHCHGTEYLSLIQLEEVALFNTICSQCLLDWQTLSCTVVLLFPHVVCRSAFCQSGSQGISSDLFVYTIKCDCWHQFACCSVVKSVPQSLCLTTHSVVKNNPPRKAVAENLGTLCQLVVFLWFPQFSGPDW